MKGPCRILEIEVGLAEREMRRDPVAQRAPRTVGQARLERRDVGIASLEGPRIGAAGPCLHRARKLLQRLVEGGECRIPAARFHQQDGAPDQRVLGHRAGQPRRLLEMRQRLVGLPERLERHCERMVRLGAVGGQCHRLACGGERLVGAFDAPEHGRACRQRGRMLRGEGRKPIQHPQGGFVAVAADFRLRQVQIGIHQARAELDGVLGRGGRFVVAALGGQQERQVAVCLGIGRIQFQRLPVMRLRTFQVL